jgi:hypothetical protein
MIHLSLLLVGFLLGIFACAILLVLMLAHRPLYTPTTMHRGRDRLPEVRHVPTMPVCKVARDDLPVEPIYMYGVTGEER